MKKLKPFHINSPRFQPNEFELAKEQELIRNFFVLLPSLIDLEMVIVDSGFEEGEIPQIFLTQETSKYLLEGYYRYMRDFGLDRKFSKSVSESFVKTFEDCLKLVFSYQSLFTSKYIFLGNIHDRSVALGYFANGIHILYLKLRSSGLKFPDELTVSIKRDIQDLEM